METSIVDVPRKYSEADLFGIKVYQDALIDFISYTKPRLPLLCKANGEVERHRL